MSTRPIDLLLIAGFALAAITAPALGADLLGTTWVLQDINGTPVIDAPKTTLIFAEDGNAGGQGGCNGYGGSVHSEGEDGMKFENVISTMMACDEPIMSQEQSFFGALEATTRYHLSGDTLFLLDDVGNKLVTFEPE